MPAVKTHRYIYAVVFGPPPPGVDVHHTCRTRRCVNPYHLETIRHDSHGEMSQAIQWSEAYVGEAVL